MEMANKHDRRQVNDFLTKHIQGIGSIKNHVLQEFYKEQTEERDNFEYMIKEYISNVKNFMNFKNDPLKEQDWPLVLIDSVVEVEYLEDNEVDLLKIVPPYYQSKANKLDCASCLSPVGSALLLKKVGDEITVQTPLGHSNMIVKSIELPSL